VKSKVPGEPTKEFCMRDEGLLIPIFALVFMTALIIVWISTRHRERMSMIEKGMSSEDIKALYMRQVTRDPLGSLKWGILLLMGGAAALLANFMHDRFGMDEGAGVGMVVLGVGVGLVVYYLIASKKATQ